MTQPAPDTPLATSAAQPQWYLELLLRDGSVQQRLALTEQHLREGLKIGRALDNDLVIDDPHSAAHHALLTIDPEQNRALVRDLGTLNALHGPKGRRAAKLSLSDAQPWRIGHTQLRVRCTGWPIEPEQRLASRHMWLWSLLALSLILSRTAWDTWLTEANNLKPPYLYALTGTAAGLAVWSAVYALLGRILGGVDRFFTHLLIACSGVLALLVLNITLEVLAFSASWLWPLIIDSYVGIIVVALTVRAHLRLADPRHWPYTRYAVGLVAALAMLIPLAQGWISKQRLTDVQTISHIEHPALRLAKPVDAASYFQGNTQLQEKALARRQRDSEGREEQYDDD
jgi:hypothetical protein